MNEMHFLTKGKDAFIYYSLDDVCTYTCTLFMKYEEIKQIDLNEYAIFVILFCFFWTPKHLTKVDMLLFIFHNVSIEVEPSCVQGKLILPIYIYGTIVRKVRRCIHSRKIIFLEGNAQGKYDFLWVNMSSYHGMSCVLHWCRPTYFKDSCTRWHKNY